MNIKRVFKPAVSLMNLLSYPKKMALMAFIFTLPLLVFLYLLISETNTAIRFAREERMGASFNQTVSGLLRDVQRHRGMAAALLSGRESFEGALESVEGKISERILEIDEADRKFAPVLKTTEQWHSLKEQWRDLKQNFRGMKPGESFDAHTVLISGILDLMNYAADASHLSLDPFVDTYYLMDTMVNKLPLAAEYAGQLRGLGVGTLVPAALSPQETTHLIILSGLCRSAYEGVADNMERAFRNNPQLRLPLEGKLKESLASINGALAMMEDRVINARRVTVEPAEYFDTFTQAIDLSFELHAAVAASLDHLLLKAIDDRKGRRFYIQAAAILTLVVLGYLFAGNYNSIMDSLNALVRASRSIAQGKLDVKVRARTRDELSVVARSFNEMVDSLALQRTKVEEANKSLQGEILIRRHTEEILRESQRSISTLMSNLPGMAYRCRNDRDWTMEFVSEGCRELTGYEPAEIIGNRAASYASLIHPDDQESVWNEVQEALAGNRPFRLTYRITDKQGTIKWVWEQGRGVSDNGEMVALEGFITNITDRKLAEQALRESETRYRVIAETASDAIMTIDEESRVLFANPAVEKVFGYRPEEVLGQEITMLMPERLRKVHVDSLERYVETARRTFRWSAVQMPGLHKSGREIPLEISYGEFRTAGKTYFTGILRDITERKEAEKEKEYKNMLETFNRELETVVAERTINLMALKLADRVRTPATVIGWTGKKIASGPDTPADIREGLRDIVEEADRLEGIVREFQSLLKSKQPVFGYEDINELVCSIANIVEKEAKGKNVDMETEISEEPLRINVQKELLRMAFFTMLRNAVESTPEGGRVTIRTWEEDQNVCFSVADGGEGIPAESLERIFDPEESARLYRFGMGMPLIKQIVSEHLGEIKVQSEPGKGTRFTIVFPSRWMQKSI